VAITLSKSNDEIQQLPLVELAWEILRSKKEPIYFREIMREIQTLRGMSEEAVMDVIARLYTEINIDGRFVCVGQNVWALKRWYAVDKVSDRAPSAGKKFVRRSGDAFSDDDEDLDEDFDELAHEDEDADELFSEDAEATPGFVEEVAVEDDDVDEEEAETADGFIEEPLEEEEHDDDSDED